MAQTRTLLTAGAGAGLIGASFIPGLQFAAPFMAPAGAAVVLGADVRALARDPEPGKGEATGASDKPVARRAGDPSR